MRKPIEQQLRSVLSRREFVVGSGLATTAAGLSAAGLAQAGAHAEAKPAGMSSARAGKDSGARAPFTDLREYLAAMEDYGLLARFTDVDQDAWEATAIMQYLSDRFGLNHEPAVVFENIRINGRWIKGPLVGNHMSHLHQEAIVWGLEPDEVDPNNSYRRGLQHMLKLLEQNDGDYPQILPVAVDRAQAPCKEIVLEGDDIDITAFAFIQGNPGDAGRYINTASTVTFDPEWGQNIGTYRAQIIGPRTIMLNSEPNQTANKTFLRARERGDTKMKIAMILGQDPVTWVVSGSRVPLIPRYPVDEYAYVGGLRGKALEIVKCELSDLTVPAYSEMIIEGELDLVNLKPEGPYHETYGYLGDRNEDRYEFTVQRITHRRDPILLNSFTSIGGGFSRVPMDAYSHRFWTQRYPQIQQIYYHDDTKGVYYASIKKDRPGIGLEIARAVSERSQIAKLMIVVDDDLDVMNRAEMMLALGSRWQPHPASHIYKSAPASFFEPSSADGKTTSKIAIDATMQWPEEGGPAEFPALNRNLWEAAAAPDIMDRILAKWPEQLQRKPW